MDKDEIYGQTVENEKNSGDDVPLTQNDEKNE